MSPGLYNEFIAGQILSDQRTAKTFRKLNQPRRLEPHAEDEPMAGHVPADLRERARLLAAARKGDPKAVETLRVKFKAWIVVGDGR